MNASVPVLQTPDVSFDGGSLDFLAATVWSERMTALLLTLSFVTWLDLVWLMSGGWASTSGAVYTASGIALIIAATGQALVRSQAARLSSLGRGLLMTICVAVLVSAAALIPFMTS